MHQHPPEISIDVRSLGKSFSVYQKKAGLFAAISSIFHRKWSKVSAINNVSFSIKKGEFVGLLGPNGAGKTTIVKILSGILSQDAGTVLVAGHSPIQRKKSFLKKIALVMGQRSQLIWDLPPEDTFAAHGIMYEIPPKILSERVHKFSSMLDVKHVLQTPSRQLSLGERMKCELILAFLHDPQILFLDEPTIGLDASSQIKIWEFLKECKKLKQITVILTSHYAQDIENLCTRILLINRGRLCFDGDLRELMALSDPEKKIALQVAAPISPGDKLRIKNILGKNPDYLSERQINFSLSSTVANEVIRALLSFLSVSEISVQESDISSLFAKSVDMKNEEISIRKLSAKLKNSQMQGIVDTDLRI